MKKRLNQYLRKALFFKKKMSSNKVNVGCGPKAREGWINVDIQSFPSVDRVMDVTKEWSFFDLDYVYSEHFLEHLTVDEGIKFLVNAGRSIRRGGWLRLSTPNLEWVLKTHYKWGQLDEANIAFNSVASINRAFYGWGHRFLYSQWILEEILSEIGYQNIKFHNYGESDIDEFIGIEKHGKFSVFEGSPSVLTVDAQVDFEIKSPKNILKKLDESFIRYSKAKG